MVYVKPEISYNLSGKYSVASTSTTQNPGVDPLVSANNTHTSAVQLPGQTGTTLACTALDIGPVTGPGRIKMFSALVAPGKSSAFDRA